MKPDRAKDDASFPGDNNITWYVKKLYCIILFYLVADVSLMDSGKTVMQTISINIGDKAGVTVGGVLTEIPDEIKFWG